MNKQWEFEELQKESYEAFKYLENFCIDYTKSFEERQEFLNNLSIYLDCEIELEKRCNE